MDLPSFRQKLEKEGYSYKQWREQARQQLMVERLQQRYVMNRITITDREIENFLATQTQQGTISNEYHILHILIATPEAPSPENITLKQQKAEEVVAKLKQGADFEATAVAISDSRQALDGGDLGWLKAGEMPTLFDGVVNQMKVDEIKGPLRDSSGFHIIKLVEKRGGKIAITQTKARHILMKTNELMSDVEIEFRLKEIKSRIELGDDFAKLAEAYSEDTGSAAKGGSLGWVNPGDLATEFEAVMNDLSVNKVSDPFKSRFGWHIVQVLERRQHDNTEQALRYQAARQIHQRKVYEELEAWLRQLRDQAYIDYRIANLADDIDFTEE
ncbi:survival protein SurA [Beggiatoa sp. PS]|nr:survival protein SurA [Beggiatoa sp. PS]